MTSYSHITWPVARIKHEVMFRKSLPGGGTGSTSDSYSVSSSLSECGRHRGQGRGLGGGASAPQTKCYPPKQSSPVLIFLCKSAQKCIISRKIPQKLSGVGTAPFPDPTPLGRNTSAPQNLPPRRLNSVPSARPR